MGAILNTFQIKKINVRVRVMGDKCVRDKASNVMDCVMDMTEVEEGNIDMEVLDNKSEGGGPSCDETSRVGVGSPYPFLTAEKVLETFKRISAIKTPEINSKLAIPFNKQSVVSSVKFNEEYSEVKSNLRKVSGGLGKEAYQAEKERRKSEPFSWPNPSPPARGRIDDYWLNWVVWVCSRS